jgi:nucleoside-diphosphate-sugar epimerase
MVIAPIRVGDAVDAMLAVGAARTGGIVQTSGDRDVTYVDIAGRLAELLGSPQLVEPVEPAAGGISAENVAEHERLDTTALEDLGLRAPRSWDVIEESLSRIVENA